MTKLTKTKDGRWLISTDFKFTQSFDPYKPSRIERIGMTENKEGIYQLTYILKEEDNGVK
jgi:hypothetical protein